MTNRRDWLREDAKSRILRLLQQNPGMSRRKSARAVKAGTGGILHVLSARVDKG